MKEVPKAYEPKKYEDKIYSAWDKSGFFNPDKLKGAPYSIMMPPPNVTGVLHLGHALENSLMDVMARYQRLQGKKVLLLPGTDHSAVATQAKVEKVLMESGIKHPREELGREKLLAEIRKYAENSKKIILSQIRKMGTSCDWSRLAYTFDEDRNKAVVAVFKKMYDDGLIYRGFKAVNWSVKGQSTLSDDEIVYVERKAKFYTFKYSREFPITIATTRPETKLGDTAVAVNPKDARYKKYIGKTFDIDFVGVPLTIKIIADKNVDMEFGTGALGVTPAHSLVDYEMAVRNGLKILRRVINEEGVIAIEHPENINQENDFIVDLKTQKKLLEAKKEYTGLSIEKAREKIIEKLKKQGLFVKEEEVDQSVGTSDRFGDIVEVLPKTQWFVAVNKKIPGRNETLKEIMKEAVGKNGVRITPKRFEKTYFQWIDNLRDWCISRQIYWGHRIPVYYRKQEITNDELQMTNNKGVALWQDIYVGDKAPGKGWEQDPDTLDTWFSSGLWTFSTLGWPLTKVIFVRHGQAEGNVRGILDEHSDTDWNGLTEKGIKQVLKITGEIKKYGAVKIFSSPVKRTKETAEIIAKELGVKIEFDDRIREIGVGEFQGEGGDGFAKARTEFYNGGKNGYKIESLEDLEKRSASFLKDLNKKYAGKTVIVVSHGDPIAYMSGIAEFSKKKIPGDYPPTGSYVIRGIDNNGEADEDLKEFHPTDWMQMGHEILFFWMARMILMSEYALKEIPFKDVYIHGILRDEKGNKFSKSSGNNIDPLDVIKKYGTDALRFSLLAGVSPGQDQRFYFEKVEGARNLVNKIWNISRFITTNKNKSGKEGFADKWIISKFNTLVTEVTGDFDNFRFSQAGERLREFTWSDFADWYLEASKVEGGKYLKEILEKLLILWHPFVPFVTEAIWSDMLGKRNLIVAEWPKTTKKLGIGDFEKVKELIIKIRNLRAENKIEAGKIVNFEIASKTEKLFKDNLEIIERLSKSKINLKKSDAGTRIKLLAKKQDKEKTKARLQKELDEKEEYLSGLNKKLANKEFIVKAPKSVVDSEREKLRKAEEEIENIKSQLKNL